MRMDTQEHDEKIVCPHCLFEYGDDVDLNECNEGEKWECNSCKKDFRITAVVRTRSFTTDKETDVLLGTLRLTLREIKTNENNGLDTGKLRTKREELSMELADLFLKELSIDETTY